MLRVCIVRFPVLEDKDKKLEIRFYAKEVSDLQPGVALSFLYSGRQHTKTNSYRLKK